MLHAFAHILKVADEPLVSIGEHIAHHVHKFFKPLAHNLYNIFLVAALQQMRILQHLISFYVNIVDGLLVGIVIKFLE